MEIGFRSGSLKKLKSNSNERKNAEQKPPAVNGLKMPKEISIKRNEDVELGGTTSKRFGNHNKISSNVTAHWPQPMRVNPKSMFKSQEPRGVSFSPETSNSRSGLNLDPSPIIKQLL